MKILQIKSSILGDNSVSSKYTTKLVEQLKGANDQVIVRDVAKNPVTQLSGAVLGALQDPTDPVAREHNSLIAEIQSADVIVIAAPMYNFSIPSTLKNYFDAITKVGVTFKYSEQGQPIGLIQNKKAHVVITRGGKYKENGMTFQEDYLKVQLGFLGITDVKFVFVEGIAMGAKPEDLDASFAQQVK